MRDFYSLESYKLSERNVIYASRLWGTVNESSSNLVLRVQAEFGTGIVNGTVPVLYKRTMSHDHGWDRGSAKFEMLFCTVETGYCDYHLVTKI